MNCLWLLILLFCSQNRNERNTSQSNVCGNSNNCGRNHSVNCGNTERQGCCGYERERDRDMDSNCDCERRTFIPFGNQTCGCEGNQS